MTILLNPIPVGSTLTFLNTASLLTADGIGVIYASKILKNPIPERCAGFDVTCRLFEKMAKTSNTVYLFGSKPGVGETAKQNIEQKYPGIRENEYKKK